MESYEFARADLDANCESMPIGQDPAPSRKSEDKPLILLLEALLGTPAPGRRKAERPTLEALNASPELKQPRTPRDLSAPVHLGHLVRLVRKERGLSQGELAQFTGVGRRFISELENGKQTLEFGLVLRVCAAMGIEMTAKKR